MSAKKDPSKTRHLKRQAKPHEPQVPIYLVDTAYGEAVRTKHVAARGLARALVLE